MNNNAFDYQQQKITVYQNSLMLKFQTNFLLKNQKQNFKVSLGPSLISTNQSQRSYRSRQKTIQQSHLSNILKVQSDNNQDRKATGLKILKIANSLPKKIQVLKQNFDDYGVGNKKISETSKQRNQQNVHHNQYFSKNLCPFKNSKENSLPSQKPKSKYKQIKDKVKKFIQINIPKNYCQSVANQPQIKIFQPKSFYTATEPDEQYFAPEASPNISQTTSRRSKSKQKVEKCTTLKLMNRQSMQGRHQYKNQSRQSSERSISINLTNKKKVEKKTSITPKQLSKKYFRKTKFNQQSFKGQQQSFRVIQTPLSKHLNYQNPLSLQQNHLFSEKDQITFQKLLTLKKRLQQRQQNIRSKTPRQSQLKNVVLKVKTNTHKKNKQIPQKLKKIDGNKNNSRTKNKYDQSKNMIKLQKQIENKIERSNSKQSLQRSILTKLENFNANSQGQINSSHFLRLSSKVSSGQQIAFNEFIRQKILIHFQTIKTIADYAQSFVNIYQDYNEWEDLIFLLYKKYYIERLKVYHILKSGFLRLNDGSIYQQSPFVFDFCSVSIQEIEVLRSTNEGVSLELNLQSSNSEVKFALRQLYNKFIDKTFGNASINMQQVDDFVSQILENLNEQVDLLVENRGKSQKITKRINQAIQVGLIIAHLKGYFFESIEEIAIGQLENHEYFDKFYPKFLQIFSNVEQNQE